MNRGSFHTQIDTAWKIVRTLKLDRHRNYYPSYPENSASIFRRMSYVDIWKECLKNQYYDFQLNDNSLIQFRAICYNPPLVTYSFYECPYHCLSYADFLNEKGLDIVEVGSNFIPQYEEYLLNCDLKEAVTPIRYDFYPNHYQEGIHPASHVHFGHINNVRVATKKILKPVSFLLLVIRQYYPNDWIILLSNQNARGWCRNIRTNLRDVDVSFWNRNDKNEMVLE